MIAKKMIKKLLSIVAAIIICMGTATCVQAADEDFDVDGNGKLTEYLGPGGDITIPSTVKSIDAYVFTVDSITSVVIPSSIISIGDSAFAECSILKSVTIKGNNITIENLAFQYCSALEDITIESTDITIKNDAFLGCSNLKCVTIESVNITNISIADNTFKSKPTFFVRNTDVKTKLENAGVTSTIKIAGSDSNDDDDPTPTPTPNPGNGSGGGSGSGSGLPNTSAEDRSHLHLIVFCSLAALTACTYGLKRRFSDV